MVLALRELLPEGGEVHTPYGATEALPLCDVAGSELATLAPTIAFTSDPAVCGAKHRTDAADNPIKAF